MVRRNCLSQQQTTPIALPVAIEIGINILFFFFPFLFQRLLFIEAAVKFVHFNFESLIKTSLKYYYLRKFQRHCLCHRAKRILNLILSCPLSLLCNSFCYKKVNFNAISAGTISLLLCYSFNLTSSLNQWSAGYMREIWQHKLCSFCSRDCFFHLS